MTKNYSNVCFSRFLATCLVFLCLFISALHTEVFAAEYSVYGPRVFLRGSGTPTIETDTITATAPGSSYLLKISNGSMVDDTYEYVSSSVIMLNGVDILAPNELNQNVDYIEKTVTLNSANDFSVEVRGKPGGALIINIDGIDNIAPVISATVAPQANSQGWHNTDVTVTFDCSDNISGIASCPAPVTIATEGADQVITGTAVDNAGNTADISVTVSLDKSQPVVNISSPVEGSLLTEPGLIIIGQIVDTSSSVNASLNGNAVTLQTDGSFSHSVTLLEGLNVLTVVATDSAGNTNVNSLSVTLQSNQPPVATSLALVLQEDTTTNVILSANDPDGDILSYQIQAQPLHGVISGIAPNLVYTPNTDFNGTDSLTYLANDRLLDSNIATVTFDVQAVNDAPVANDQTVIATEDTAVSIIVAGSDIDADTLNYQVVTQPAQGVLSGVAPNLTYTPNANYSGVDSFTFKANDGLVDSTIATISITVNAINDVPVANNQTVTTNEDTAVAVVLSATDADGDALTYIIATQPLNGVITGVVPNITYTPNGDFSGADSLTFLVNDGLLDSAIATVTFDVQAVNDAPVANNQSVTTNEDTAVAVMLSATDVDGDALTYSIATQPSNGVITGVVPNITYTPNGDFSGNDSFTFKVNDGTVYSGTATITINVNAANDAPVADAQTVSTKEDVALSITLTGSDIEGDSLNYSIVTQPSNGVLSGTAPNLTYTPNNNFSGLDSILFVVSDGQLNSTNALININVVAVNDSPVINSQPITSITSGEIYKYAVNAFDVDSDPLTYSLLESPDGMDVGLVTGALIWVPTAAQLGEHTVSIQVNDGRGGIGTQSFVITVSEVPNLDPEITSSPLLQGFMNEAYNYQIAAQDQDGDNLSYSLTSGPTGMTLSFMSGIVHWLPNSGQIGSHSVTVRVDDGKGGYATQSFTINVETGSNAAPVITSSAVINSLPDSLYGYPVVATDANGDVLSYVLTNAPGGMIIHGETGLINWTPTNSEIGNHDISLRVFDSKGAFDEQNYVLTVALDTTENQGPSITSTPITSVTQDETYFYDVEADDPNNDTLTYTLSQAPDNMTINPTSGEIAWSASRVLPSYALEPHTQCEATPQNLALSDLVIKTLMAQEIAGDAANGLNVSIEVFNRGLKQSDEAQVTLYADVNLTTVLGTVTVPAILSNEATAVQLTLNNAGTLTQLFAEVKINSAITLAGIPGTSNMWLAGMPDGTTSVGDTAPTNSPVLINGIDLSVEFLTFVNVTGGVSHTSSCDLSTGTGCAFPDGESFWNHTPGAINGISDVRVPIDALLGVFLDDSQPDSSPAPETLNFETLGTDFASISPKLKQVFFIGDGLTGTSSGEVQNFIIPEGATRLYLGTMDGYGWYDNSGAYDLEIHANVNECVEDNNLGHVYLVDVNAADPAGLSDSQIFSVQTLPKQVAPQITSSDVAGEVYVAGTLEHQIVVTDNNIGDAFSYTLLGAPTGLSISKDGLISWTPTIEQVGNYTITVIVTDLAGNQATQTITVTIVPNGNKPPVITNQVDNPIIYAPVSSTNPNIVMHLEFEDGFNDSSAYANNAVVDSRSSGLVTTIPDAGVIGDALTIQDGLGWLTVANSSSLSMTEALTMSAWINPTGKVGNNAGVFFKGQLNATQPDWQIVVGDVGTGGNTGASGAAASINGTGYATAEARVIDYSFLNPIPTGIWTYVAVTYDGQELRLYVNGTLVDVDPHVDSINALGSDLYIGNRFMPSGDVGGFQGLMDELRVYDVALSQSEINSLANNIVGSKFSHQVLVSDPGTGDTHQFSMLGAPEGMTIDETTGLIEWTPSFSQIGEVTFTVIVTDSLGATGQQEITLTVTATNSAPEITSSPADVVKIVSETFNYTVEAFDPEGSDIQISLLDAPVGMTLDSSNMIQWTATEAGVYNVVIRASDGDLFTDQSFAITVNQVGAGNHPPVITSTPVAGVVAGENYQYQTDAYDPEGGDLQFELIGQPAAMQVNSNGLISWLPQVADIGSYNVVVRVTDLQGAYVDQSYTLAVVEQSQELNQLPSITSMPVFTAWAGKVYSYQVTANDADGDSLSYQLSTAPNGMTIDTNGLISWQTTDVEIGSHNVTVTVSDSQGGNVQQSYVLAVYQNGAPVITSVPSLQVSTDDEYHYQAEAVDDNSDVISFSLDTAPTGMVIHSQTGVVTWTPSALQVDSHSVVIRVTDDSGAFSTQSFSLQVHLPNQAPVISSTPQQYAYVNSVYQYQVAAEDADGDAISYELQSGPQGMTMDATGLVNWSPTQTQIAIHQVEVRVSDGIAATIQIYQLQAFDVPGPLALWVNILPPTIAPGETTDIQLVTEGGRGYITRQLWIDGQQVALNEQGAAQVTSDVFGRHDIFARVADDTDVQTFSGVFSVTDPSDTQLPTVSIANVNDQDVVTAPIEVVGTVHDDNIRDWMLFIREAGAPQDEYTLIAEGNTNIANAPLGIFDPTLLQNGQFDIVLQATDINDQTSVTSVIVTVEGNLKVGNFSFTVQDINIPLAGIPVQVNRTYDSRRRNQKGDFSYGWTIDYQNVKVETSRDLGAAWGVNTYYGGPLGAIATFCIEPFSGLNATVTLPDDSVEAFAVTAVNACNDFVVDLDVELEFTPTGNTLSTLRLENATTVRLVNGNLEILGSSQVYNPSLFVLTTKQGLEYHLDQNFGITQVIDPNGNTLTYSDSGIVHSSGKSVNFIRDGQGRITRISPPAGDAIEYTYNLFDDLVTAGNINANTQYTYNNNHGLLDIIDPLGRKQLRNIYDDSGRLIAQEDTNGVRTEYTHDLEGQTSIVSDRLGRITQFAYDERGNVLSVVDALNNLTQYTYDADDNQISTIDALGNVTSATYDNRRNQLSQTDALGNTISFTYNQRGQELAITDALNNQFINTYDGVGNLLTVQDPLGNIAGNNINAQGLPTLVRNAAGFDTTYTYDEFGNKLTETDHLGNATTYTYDVNGNVLSQSVQRTIDGVIVAEETTYEYDTSNRLIRTTNPEGHQTQHLYDAADNIIRDITPTGSIDYGYDVYHRLTSTSYPDLTTELKVYDAEGNLTSETDRNGNITNYIYDALNRLIQTDYADGSNSQSEYDALDRVTADIDENGNRSEHEYDAAGRRTLTRDALSFETTFSYDANGNLISQTDANGNTTQYEYDTLDNRIKMIYPDLTESLQSYDALGQLISKTDQNGLVTQYSYDALGRLTKVTDALLNETSYTYGETGNKLTQTDAMGRTTSWTYDGEGNQLSRTLQLGQSETWVYSTFTNNLQSHTDFNGDTKTYNYDTNNRVSRISYADRSTEVFTYDAEGNRIEATYRTGRKESWTYDNRNRLTNSTKIFGDQIDYAYDSAGNRTQLTVTPSAGVGEVIDYSFDALNRLETVTDALNQVTTYSYDNVGNRASVLYPNGNITSYVYDDLNRLVQQTTKDSLSNVLTDYQYTLDASGHRTQIIEASGRTSNYVYDDLYRLTTEDISDALNGNYNASYQYDAVGNRTGSIINGVSTVYTVDANDRLTQQGGETFSYDDNGNTLTKAIDADITTYSYNAKNELEQADITVLGVNTLTSYQYDVDGIRTRKIANGETIDFLVDANRDYAQVIKETNATTGNIIDYLYGDDLIKQTNASNDSYYLYDGLGSARALTNSAGTITDTYNYESFGAVLNQTGATENNYLFTGEQYDNNLDNYYLRARYYDQDLGRFTQMDTWVGNNQDPVTLHKYLYANANPVTYVDPTGNFSLVSFAAADSIRSILAETTVNVGLSLLDGALSDDASESPSNPLAVGALVIAGGGGVKLLKLLSSKCRKLKDKCSFTQKSGWGFWKDYPKVKFGSKEYAVINSRYYTRHAVDRMTPSGYGTAAGGLEGRSISPTFVENIIMTGSKKIVFTKKGEMRNVYTSGTAEVITEAGNRIVITVNPFINK